MNGLSLFSGIGGLDLGLERAGIRTVGQVEIDPWCRRVLAKHWPDVPRHDDVRTAADWWLGQERPHVDFVFGGFPCQDISNAGRRAGIDAGERSSLWFAMVDVVRLLRPRWVLVENVAAIRARGAGRVLGTLAEIGYDAEWDCIPAEAFGAPHERDRWFAVAYPNGEQLRNQPVAACRRVGATIVGDDGPDGTLADTQSVGRRQGRPQGPAGDGAHRPRVQPEALALRWRRPARSAHWATEPEMGRVAHGVPGRVDRLRGLGNAVVPQVAEHVGRLIVAADQERAA